MRIIWSPLSLDRVTEIAKYVAEEDKIYPQTRFKKGILFFLCRQKNKNTWERTESKV